MCSETLLVFLPCNVGDESRSNAVGEFPLYHAQSSLDSWTNNLHALNTVLICKVVGDGLFQCKLHQLRHVPGRLVRSPLINSSYKTYFGMTFSPASPLIWDGIL